MLIQGVAEPCTTFLKLITISHQRGNFWLCYKPDRSGFTPNMHPVKLRETLTHQTIVAVGPPSGACNFSHQNFADWWWTLDAITVTLTMSAASVWAGQRDYTLATCREILNKSEPRGTDRISFRRGSRHLTKWEWKHADREGITLTTIRSFT